MFAVRDGISLRASTSTSDIAHFHNDTIRSKIERGILDTDNGADT